MFSHFLPLKKLCTILCFSSWNVQYAQCNSTVAQICQGERRKLAEKGGCLRRTGKAHGERRKSVEKGESSRIKKKARGERYLVPKPSSQKKGPSGENSKTL